MSRQRQLCAIFAMFFLAAPFAFAATTVHVVPVTNNPTASGTNLLNALAGIVTANAANPFVLKLDPGIYDVGSTALQMKSFVDIEGSGQQITTIRGLGNNVGFLIGVVQGARSSELRDLTVSCLGNGFANAIPVLLNNVNTSVRDVTLVSSQATASWGLRCLACTSTLQDLTVRVSGGTQAYGIAASGASLQTKPVIRRAVITLSGAAIGHGIYSDQNAAPVVRDVEIAVTGGTTGFGLQYNYSLGGLSGGALEVTNSKIGVSGTSSQSLGIDVTGSANTFTVTHTNIAVATTGPPAGAIGIRTTDPSATPVFFVDHCDVAGGASVSAPFAAVRIGASKLAGPVNVGAPTCAASFNGNYAPLNAACL
jgi:hypothetical protein